MGWTTFQKDTWRDLSVKAIMRKEFEQEWIEGVQTGFQVIYDAVKNNTYWAILDRTDKYTGETTKLCEMALFRNGKTEFSYKAMTESEGPFYFPGKRFLAELNRLIPTPPNDYAMQFRIRARGRRKISLP